MTNRISKAKCKIACTRGPRPRPIVARLVIWGKRNAIKRKRFVNKKKDSSDPSSSDDSDSSYDSDYRRKQHKRKSHRENDPIKVCTNLTAKLLMTAYKSNIVRFKINEDSIQRRIYFLSFVESLEMIFSQYIETCEVLVYYSKIGGGDIKDFTKKGH